MSNLLFVHIVSSWSWVFDYIFPIAWLQKYMLNYFRTKLSHISLAQEWLMGLTLLQI